MENWETVVAPAKKKCLKKGGGGYKYKYWREGQVNLGLRTTYWF